MINTTPTPTPSPIPSPTVVIVSKICQMSKIQIMSKICHAITLQTTRHYYALPRGALKSHRGPHISVLGPGEGGPKFTVRLRPRGPI